MVRGLVSPQGCRAGVFVIGCAPPHCRDNEKAYVTVNGKTCWSKTLGHKDGSNQCGSTSSTSWREESYTVECEEDAVSGKLTVRVHADLSSTATDESFAIDNVVVSQILPGTFFQFIFVRAFYMAPYQYGCIGSILDEPSSFSKHALIFDNQLRHVVTCMHVPTLLTRSPHTHALAHPPTCSCCMQFPKVVM